MDIGRHTWLECSHAKKGNVVEITEKELTQLLDNLLLSTEATPDDSCLLLSDGNKQWFEVLGVQEDANKSDIVNAFRSLAKIHHPDVGGTNEDFKRIRSAYESGISNLK